MAEVVGVVVWMEAHKVVRKADHLVPVTQEAATWAVADWAVVASEGVAREEGGEVGEAVAEHLAPVEVRAVCKQEKLVAPLAGVARAAAVRAVEAVAKAAWAVVELEVVEKVVEAVAVVDLEVVEGVRPVPMQGFAVACAAVAEMEMAWQVMVQPAGVGSEVVA